MSDSFKSRLISFPCRVELMMVTFLCIYTCYLYSIHNEIGSQYINLLGKTCNLSTNMAHPRSREAMDEIHLMWGMTFIHRCWYQTGHIVFISHDNEVHPVCRSYWGLRNYLLQCLNSSAVLPDPALWSIAVLDISDWSNTNLRLRLVFGFIHRIRTVLQTGIL